MRVKFKVFLCLFMAFIISCNKTDNETIEVGSLEVSFTSSITSRATETAFEVGDEIYVSAYDESESVYATDQVYTYDGSLFSSTSPITYKQSGDKLSFYAVYPNATVSTTKVANFSVAADQSSDSGYADSDLLFAYTGATSSATPELTFEHLLTKVVVNISSSQTEVIDAVTKINAMQSVECDLTTLATTLKGSITAITMASNGDNSYKVILPPQTITSSSAFASMTINGESFDIYYSSDIELVAGKEYTISATVDGSSITFGEPVVNDWDNGEFPHGSEYNTSTIYSDGTWTIADSYSLSSMTGSLNDLFDKNTSTYVYSSGLTSSSESSPHWLVVDLRSNYVIDAILLTPRSASSSHRNSGYFEVSTDYKNWNYVGDFSIDSGDQQTFSTTPTVGRFVRINCTSNYVQLAEFAIQGDYMGESTEVVLSGTCTKAYFAGNSYVTVSGQQTPSITYTYSAAISNWTSTSSVISTYVYLHSAGEYTLAIDASGTSVINVSSGDYSYDVTLDNTSVSEVAIGTFYAESAGYIKVDFQGVKSSASNGSFGQIESLNIYGIDNVSCVNNYWSSSDEYSSWYWGRRGPSVHMSYTLPSGNTEWFYNEITVPDEGEVLYSYYMAAGFGQGYFGMQYNSDSERRVLFSVWAPYETDDPNDIPDEYRIVNTRRGEDVYIGEFGNEGSGGQSYLVYPWKAGVTYKFLMHVEPAGDGTTNYTAYFYATDENRWRLIASFMRPLTDTWYSSPYSFLENFGTESGCLDRIFYMGNQWAYSSTGTWTRITKGTFTYDATASAGVRLDYQGGLSSDGRYFLRMGGFFTADPATSYYSSYTSTYMGDQPSIDFDALKAIADYE